MTTKKDFMKVMENRTVTELLSVFFGLCGNDKRLLLIELNKFSARELQMAAEKAHSWKFSIQETRKKGGKK